MISVVSQSEFALAKKMLELVLGHPILRASPNRPSVTALASVPLLPLTGYSIPGMLQIRRHRLWHADHLIALNPIEFSEGIMDEINCRFQNPPHEAARDAV